MHLHDTSIHSGNGERGTRKTDGGCDGVTMRIKNGHCGTRKKQGNFFWLRVLSYGWRKNLKRIGC
jgi:hypothetical protein